MALYMGDVNGRSTRDYNENALCQQYMTSKSSISLTVFAYTRIIPGMTSSRTLLLSITSCLLLGACGSSTDSGNQDSSAQTSSVRIEDIFLSSPLPNTVVTSPLIVEGEAHGTWYFEASFPVRLLDANGNEIAVTPAQAQGDWMTEDLVPYTALLEFSQPSTPTGTLVLQKDNPSGMPENDKSLSIPVSF